MKLILQLLLILTLTGTSRIAWGQEYVSSTFIRSLDKNYFLNNYGLAVHSGVDLYRMLYTTVDLEGRPDTASGLVVLPVEKGYDYSISVYHHGTVGSRFEVPSYSSGEDEIAALFGALGFVSLAPDYIGLGDSRGFHPYIHANSEAWATRDMVMAVEEFCELNATYVRKRVLFTGYSQGGHAGMAAHRLFETEDLGYEVPAAAHMSGPYVISEVMKDMLLSDEEYPLVAYLPFVSLSYNEVYGIFNGNIQNFFIPKYATAINRFYNEEIDLWTLNGFLANTLLTDHGGVYPKFMIQPDMLASILSDDDHPVNLALKDNDVHDWAPEADTKLFYCGADEQVDFQNSITCESTMKQNGAPEVEAINLNNNADHGGCVSPALTASLFHFLAYRDLLMVGVEEAKLFDQVGVYATQDEMCISNLPNGKNIFSLYGYDGNVYFNNKLINETTIPVNLNSGVYILVIQHENGAYTSKKVFVR
jgi:hypothetical protein